MLSNVNKEWNELQTIKRTVNKTKVVRPNSAQRSENKFTIVPPVYRPEIVRLPATDGIYASPRRCGSRSTREVHNTISTEYEKIIIISIAKGPSSGISVVLLFMFN